MRRRYRQAGWYCVGCKTDHSIDIPYWGGPDGDDEGRNLYCAKTHPARPMENRDKVMQAMYHYGREKSCSIVVQSVGDWLKQALESDPTLGQWEHCIDAGKSYLVGRDVPTNKFLRTHTSTICTAWMSLAVQLVWMDASLEVRAHHDRPPLDYVIRRIGDHVEIGLPHQDAGGEKHWITKDLKHKVLINVD
jgi:hypothetical protein